MRRRESSPILALCFATFLAAPCRGADDELTAALKQFSLKAPVDVKRRIAFGDGGTIGIVLSGAEGTQFSFCLDGRFKNDLEENLDGHVFIGASYPDEKGAKEVVPGSATERALVTLLKSIISQHASAKASEPPATPDGKTNYKYTGALQQIIDRLEARWKTLEKKKPDLPPRYRK